MIRVFRSRGREKRERRCWQPPTPSFRRRALPRPSRTRFTSVLSAIDPFAFSNPPLIPRLGRKNEGFACDPVACYYSTHSFKNAPHPNRYFIFLSLFKTFILQIYRAAPKGKTRIVWTVRLAIKSAFQIPLSACNLWDHVFCTRE